MGEQPPAENQNVRIPEEGQYESAPQSLSGAPLAEGESPKELRANLWEQYKLHIDVYKFHMELANKINIFFLAITGAVVSYYNSSSTTKTFDVRSFAIPAIICLMYAIGMAYAAVIAERRRKRMKDIEERGNFQMAVEIRLLTYILTGFAVIHITISAFFFLALRDGLHTTPQPKVVLRSAR